MAGELREECLSVMPGGAQSSDSLDASRPLDQDALGRGVSLLTLYQDSVRNDQATYAYARWLTDLGGQVRTAPILPPRMLIFASADGRADGTARRHQSLRGGTASRSARLAVSPEPRSRT